MHVAAAAEENVKVALVVDVNVRLLGVSVAPQSVVGVTTKVVPANGGNALSVTVTVELTPVYVDVGRPAAVTVSSARTSMYLVAPPTIW